jgi:hypothetical protein
MCGRYAVDPPFPIARTDAPQCPGGVQLHRSQVQRRVSWEEVLDVLPDDRPDSDGSCGNA